jgi:hypothetical protein
VQATATSFPLSKHTGGSDTASDFSGRHVLFTVHLGCGPSPFSCGVFLPPPLLEVFLLLVAGRAATPAFSSRLVYNSVRGCPSPDFSAQGAPPCLLFFVVIAYYSVFFFLFSLAGGQSVQGAMLIWPRIVCGNTMCSLAHPVVCVFPSGLGAGVWLHGSPPAFSI